MVAKPGTIKASGDDGDRAVFSRDAYLIDGDGGNCARAGLLGRLRAACRWGPISGATKIRAMQIIDELEPVRRGPYGGGMGYISLDGDMDIALALRTMVVPVGLRGADGTWTYHLQAAGGIVADSQAEAEFMETVNKAAALCGRSTWRSRRSAGPYDWLNTATVIPDILFVLYCSTATALRPRMCAWLTRKR